MVSNSLSLRLMENYDKTVGLQVSTGFLTHEHFTLEGCSKRGGFGYWNNHISRSQWLAKYLRYEADFFFSQCTNLFVDCKLQWKFQKKFPIFEIIAFEGVTEISFNYHENTCDWQSTCYQTVLRFERDVF